MADALKGEKSYPHINESYIKELSKLESDTDTWYTTGMGAKFFYMRTWLQNINFHAGNQWLTYDEHKQLFELEPVLDDEIKVTVNKILPAVRLAVGKILMDRKRPIVIHKNQDEEEIEAAKVKTKLLEHTRRTENGIEREKRILTWAAIASKGYSKKWYDVEKDRVRTEIIPPFEVIVPPNVLEMDKMPWICHARFETKQWVFENYGIEVAGTSDWGQYGTFLAAVKNVMSDGNYTGVYTQGMEDNVMVKDWWIRPCKAYPKGLLVIQVNNETIYADKNPYSADDEFYWPFAELDFFDAPYRYWPISLVENLVDSQKWLNQFYTDNLENLKYANTPTWWAQEGTVVAEEVNMKPGSVNFFAGQQAPIPNNPVPFQPTVFEQASKFEQAISESAGIHFFGPGSMPPGVHAAAALAIINEQDQMAAMAVNVNHEKWVRDDAKQTLFLLKHFGPDKMMIRVMGDEGQWEVVEFKKDSITGDEEIYIESKQELASDKMTKFDQVLKLMTTLGEDQKPILDTEAGLRILNLEKDMGIVTPRNLNRNMQMDENQKLWKGEQVNVFEWEDHKLHIEALLETMLTIKFKIAKPEIQHAFMQHYQQHTAFLNNAQQQGQASQQATQESGQQPPMMPGIPQGLQPMGQPMQQGMPPQGMPPMMHGQMPMMQQGPQMGPTGLAGNLQQGMQQALRPEGM